MDLPQLVEHLKERGLLPPLILRFPSIACHRLEKLRVRRRLRGLNPDAEGGLVD